MEIAQYLLVCMVSGWLAARMICGSGYGLIFNTIVGVMGAVIGQFVVANLDLSIEGFLADALVAFLGALILVYAFSLIGGKRKKRS